jgi:hypothetical protein
MKRAVTLFVLVLSLVALMGCATTIPVASTSNAVGSKTGTASEMWILGLPPLMSKANGGITKISTVDFKIRTYFVVSWTDTVVTGE